MLRAGLSGLFQNILFNLKIFFLKLFFLYRKPKLSFVFIRIYTPPIPPLLNFVEENLVLGSEVTSCTVIYFAYESLYLTFLFIKNLTVVMHF